MLEIKSDIKNGLKEIGLDFAQQQVFMILINKGLLNIQELTNELHLPRTTVHLACESLLASGVIKVSITGKRRYFYVDNPKNIEQIVLQEENKINSKKSIITSLLPTLLATFAQSQDSQTIDIEELQGEDGFVETFNRSLLQPKNGEVLRFGGDPEKFVIARDRLKSYREERMRKKIYTKLLQPETELSKDEKSDAKFKMREVRFLPKENYNIPIQMSVWQDSVAITVWDKGLRSIIVTNKSIADAMKQIFNLLWLQAK